MKRYTASRMGRLRQRADLAAPCKGCTKREIGCHSKCQEYGDWKFIMHREYDEVKAGLQDQHARGIARAARKSENKGKWRFGK